MTKIARDPGRGAKAPHKILCVSSEGLVPVNEIQKDPKRQGVGLTIGKCFPIGKHEYLLRLIELEKMAANGDIRSVMNEATNMGIETFDAANVIASGIVKHNEKINWRGIVSKKRDMPLHNFHLACKGIVLDRAQTLIYY